MANLENLSTAVTTAKGLSDLIFAWPEKKIGYQPQNPKDFDKEIERPPKFLFNYEGEQSVALESDITDHYIEDNTPIQDHIALRPEVISTNGFIGELNDVTPEALEPIKEFADKLFPLSAFQPELSVTAQRAYNTAVQTYAAGLKIKSLAVNAWDSINGRDPEKVQTKQQIAFNQFYGYWRNRTLFTVQTPWAVFKDMAIQSLRAIQSGDSEVVTDFEISFKQIKFVSSLTEGDDSVILPASLMGRAFGQGSSLVDKGLNTPTSSISLSEGLA